MATGRGSFTAFALNYGGFVRHWVLELLGLSGFRVSGVRALLQGLGFRISTSRVLELQAF